MGSDADSDDDDAAAKGGDVAKLIEDALAPLEKKQKKAQKQIKALEDLVQQLSKQQEELPALKKTVEASTSDVSDRTAALTSDVARCVFREDLEQMRQETHPELARQRSTLEELKARRMAQDMLLQAPAARGEATECGQRAVELNTSSQLSAQEGELTSLSARVERR